MSRDLSWANLPRGALGLLFDQEYGLLWYAPLYILSIFGVRPLLRRPEARALVVCIAVTGGAFFLTTARYYMWWGGASVPARFVIPLLPMLAVFVAAGCRRVGENRMGLGVSTGLALVGVAIAATAVAIPGRYLAFNDRDGTSKWVELLQGPVLWTEALPSFLGDDWGAQLPHVLVMCSGALASLLALRAMRRWGRAPHSMPLAVSIGVLVAGIGSASAVGRWVETTEGRSALVRHGQLALLNSPERGRLFDLSAMRVLSSSAFRRSLVLPLLADTTHVDSAPPEDPAAWLGPFALPPGSFEARIWLKAGATDGGRFQASLHRTAALVASADASPPDAGPVVLRFDVPDAFRAPPIWIGATSPGLVRNALRVDLAVVDLRRPPAVEPDTPAAVENLPGRTDALLVYLDRHAFAERGVFWTEGQSETNLLVIPAGSTRMNVRLETGAAGGQVRIEIAGVPTTRHLNAHEAMTVEATLPPSQRHVPIRVAFSEGFRPRDVDRESNDGRWLGVRVVVTTP